MVKLIIILYLCLYSIVAISSSRAKYVSFFIYKDDFNESRLNMDRFEVDPYGTLLKGDIGVPAKFCNPTSNYICMVTPDITFSIPKKPNRSEWHLYGWRFKELPSREALIWGQSLRVRVVSATDMIKEGIRDNSCDHLFFYHAIKGLVANVRTCEDASEAVTNIGQTLFKISDAPFVL